MIKTKKQMYLVIGAFALVMLLGGVTYAFFNYTRTGTANTIRVGRIAFNTSQASGQDGAINLSNAFPITRTMAATDNTNAGEVVITITGDTTYSGGVEYLVTATDVTNTVNSKAVPISIIATASNGLGTSDDSYFTNRGGNSSIYKVLANETISNNDQILVGYIAPDNNQTGVNGTITIRAYLDSDLVAISDTYNNGNTPTDNLGTPASFGENKTVLTTSEWNSLRTNGVSFKVKIVAQEGTWVEEPVVAIPTIASCPGCQFMYTTNTYQYGTNGSSLSEIVINNDQYFDDYNDVITESRKHFLGFTVSNGKIDRAFVCGVKVINPNQGTAFCLEASTDGSTKNSNRDILYSVYGVDSEETGIGCRIGDYDDFTCSETESVGDEGTLWYMDSEFDGLGSNGYNACSMNYDGNGTANGFVKCW